MFDNWQNRVSIASRGVLYQFMMGIALVTVIPLMAVIYLASSDWRDAGAMARYWPFLVGLAVFLTGFLGFILLRRQPEHIVRLRNHLERVVRTELDRPEMPLHTENDMTAVEAYMATLIAELKTRMETVEVERTRLESKLLQAQKMESMRGMAIGIAHDLNNLMAAILGNVSIILRDTPKDSPHKENALQIEATALQAVDLTNQIMIFSGKARCCLQPVNVAHLLWEMKNLLAVTVPKGVSIEFHTPDGLPNVNADASLLRQVLVNLVLNAAESYPTRRGVIVVTVGVAVFDRGSLNDAYLGEALPENPYLFVEVADQGQGMSPEVQRRMFDPFFSGKIRGRGLGLSVALGVVSAHGGAIRVHSVPRKGTTVTLLLPKG